MPPKKQINKKVEEVKSLDETNIPEKLFYFKSLEGKCTYAITHKQASLSRVFGSLLENNEEESNVEEKAISFKTIYETYDLVSSKDTSGIRNQIVYTLNTDDMLSYIKQYFDIWKKNPEKSSYIDDNVHVQTGDPTQILNEADFNFLANFISLTIGNIKSNTSSIKMLIDEDKYNNTLSYKKIVDIRILSGLLAQADYLEIECLFNKICVFISCIIWNGTHIDILDATNDPYFKELQENAINAWRAQNNEHIERHIRSITTGDGRENDSDEETQNVLEENDSDSE